MFESISIKGGDDCFRLYGHLMDRSISEINYLFGMAERKAGIPTAAFVSGIGRRSGIAPSKRVPYSEKRNFSRSEEHTSELQSQSNLVCRLLLEKQKTS